MSLEDVNVIMQGANAFNHHPIMGASVDESWARRFPTELIQDKHTQGQVDYKQSLPFVSHEKEIGVIQFLVDGNPDIDAMHRLSKPLPMTFPLDGAEPVLVPTHAYVPYNAQATIHTKNAMRAMLLPGTDCTWESVRYLVIILCSVHFCRCRVAVIVFSSQDCTGTQRA